MANLFGWQKVRILMLYICAIAVMFFAAQHPKYSGPDNIVQLNPDSFERRLRQDKKTSWLVYFHADWCEECLYHDALFADLSLEYCIYMQNINAYVHTII